MHYKYYDIVNDSDRYIETICWLLAVCFTLWDMAPFSTYTESGNTLEGDVSDVIALDQLTSPFSPQKATRKSP